MQFEKFYLDVVSRDGSGCIGYAARVGGLGLDATLATLLRWTADTAIPNGQLRTLRGALPVLGRDGLVWNCEALGTTGRWTRRELPIAEKILWHENGNALRWEALAPSAEVDLRFDHATIHGWGYAERLVCDLPPWHLPIDTLRWGRFVSATQSVVWIAWQHTTPRHWLWHNGIEIPSPRITDHEIVWPGHRLTLLKGRTLRTGRLMETVFARWPRAARLLPERIRAFDETKACVRGELADSDGLVAHGWVIHEVVHFR